eukprot:TRINITY_DN12445_c0_g2_i2.p1 TRINITY_DN12445_c0_g2~~TRINITY_DN12445_c0_g2_i2.p1  ORF type:complete len:338 (+),score=82.81 TRINITY_DN12445_c0_g2_i2:73-1086(+)
MCIRDRYMKDKMYLNPCAYVRESCRKVLSQSSHVKINASAVTELAKSLKEVKAVTSFTSWAESHFPPASVPLETFLRYVFVLDTLNFCFWPNPPFEYTNLAGNLYATLKADPIFFNLENLAKASSADLKSAVFKEDFCLLEERARMVREVFGVILESYKGSCISFLAKANRSAPHLVKLVLDSFPCFRDQAIYKGCQVFLYKRAQILVSDLHLAYRDIVKAVGKTAEYEILDFGDSIKELTMFADYRVPQILRAKDVLIYSKELADLVDAKKDIPHSSEHEVEIRAGTIVAVEELKEALAKLGVSALSLEVDVYLWEDGEKIKDKVQPAHHTLSIFY